MRQTDYEEFVLETLFLHCKPRKYKALASVLCITVSCEVSEGYIGTLSSTVCIGTLSGELGPPMISLCIKDCEKLFHTLIISLVIRIGLKLC